MPFDFIKFAKTAVVCRPSLVLQMNQTDYKIGNKIQMFCGIHVANADPDSLEMCFCIRVFCFLCSWLPGS
jgi:hypothetical protein